MALPAPATSAAFVAMMSNLTLANQTLLDYCFPKAPKVGHVHDHWSPYTTGCRIATDCYCFHVEGDMSRAKNPDGWKQCAKLQTIGTCDRASDRDRKCACLTTADTTVFSKVANALSNTATHGGSGAGCLFSDMRPTKILSAVTAARAAGVTHIVEEGRCALSPRSRTLGA